MGTVPVGSGGQRSDSRETARPEEYLVADDAGENSSLTSREYAQPHLDASSLAKSQSIHLQSQVGVPTNASSDSLFIPPLPSTIATAMPTASSYPCPVTTTIQLIHLLPTDHLGLVYRVSGDVSAIYEKKDDWDACGSEKKWNWIARAHV